jgi:hypothetical protein
MLDKGLTRKTLLDKAIIKAYRARLMGKGTFSKSWGLKPRVIYCLYTATVRTIVTCAATIWWPRIKVKTRKAALSKLQRMACVGIIGAMQTIPTTATEALLGPLPMHL